MILAKTRNGALTIQLQTKVVPIACGRRILTRLYKAQLMGCEIDIGAEDKETSL